MNRRNQDLFVVQGISKSFRRGKWLTSQLLGLINRKSLKW